MNGTQLGYGPRLSDDEYQRKIVELHSQERAREDEQLRHQELDLDISHKLGQDFPDDLRQAIWEIQQKVEARRAKLRWISILERFTHLSLLPWSANLVARKMAARYRTVLSSEEVRALLGADPSDLPRFHRKENS
jgi:hypothetical protein